MTVLNLDMDAPLDERVAEHIGAKLTEHGEMRCPACGGNFGPTMPLDDLAVFELGYLPGAPLLAGVCLDCGHITEPAAVHVELPPPPATQAPTTWVAQQP